MKIEPVDLKHRLQPSINTKKEKLPSRRKTASFDIWTITLNYSALGASSATTASAAGASAADFLERRVRVAFFLVLAIFSS